MSFKGTKQIVTAFAPKIESARPKDRAALIAAMLKAGAYHRVRQEPPRTLGTTSPETPAEASDPPHATTSHRQITEESLEMVLSVVPFAGRTDAPQGHGWRADTGLPNVCMRGGDNIRPVCRPGAWRRPGTRSTSCLAIEQQLFS